jgi:hypothetical protein
MRNGITESYHLQISKTSNFTSLVLDTNNLTANIFPHANLEYFTKYYWRIKAFTPTCVSSWSEPFSFTTYVSAPNLFVPADKQSEVPLTSQFSWSATAGATQYRIQVADSSDMLFPIRDFTLDATNAFTTIENLKYSTNYYWRVLALNETKSGPWSDVWSFTTAKLTASLVSPNNLATGQQINGTLWWKDNGPGCIYRVQVATDSIFRNIVMDESGLITNSINYKDLNYITDYYWRVKAETGESKSEWTPHWKFRTIIHIPELLSPKQFAKSVNVNSFLACALIKGATKYEVELAKDSLFKNIIFSQTAATGFFKYSNLEFETTYFWHIRVYDNNTPGNWSGAWSFKTLKSGQIGSPDPVFPFIRSNAIPQKFDFKWEPVIASDNYDIQLSGDSLFSNILFEKLEMTEIFTASPQLENNKRYFWRAKACKSADCSEWSDVADFFVCLETVVLFIPEDGAIDMPNNPFLVWDNAPDAQLYQIQIARDSLFTDIAFDQNNLKKAQANAEQLDYNTVFYWRVRSFNPQNGSLWSDIRSFKTQKSTGVQELNQRYSFIYPNPAHDHLILDLRELNIENGIFKMYNSTGMVFNETKFSSIDKLIRIPLMDFPENMYIIELVSGTKVYFEKFIIAR